MIYKTKEQFKKMSVDDQEAYLEILHKEWQHLMNQAHAVFDEIALLNEDFAYELAQEG